MVQQRISNNNFLVLKLKSGLVRALLNTGSVVSLVSERFAKQHGLAVSPIRDHEYSFLISASGKPLDITGISEFSISIAGLSIPIVARVARYLSHDFIMASDFLQNNGVVIDYNLGVISIAEDLVRAPLQSTFKQRNLATSAVSVCVPAYTEALVKVNMPYYYEGRTVLLEPIPGLQFRTIATARSFSHYGDGMSVCRVFNYNPFSVVLRKGMRLAAIQSLNTIASCTPYISSAELNTVNREPLNKQEVGVLETFAKDYGFKINSDLTGEQRQELLQLLFDYKDVFARSLSEIKRYKHYEHDIHLSHNRRIFRRNYRFSPEDATIAEQQINEMLQIGVIEPTKSAQYNSPCFLVNEKNNEKRSVLDLRSLNAAIMPELVQLPKVTELIDDITSKHCKFLSSLDLRTGYWQIPISKRSRPYTTFTAPL